MAIPRELEAGGECQGSVCPHCGGKAWMSRRYDALFCPVCDIWLEEPCASPVCEYCAQRPERPSQAGKPQE